MFFWTLKQTNLQPVALHRKLLKFVYNFLRILLNVKLLQQQIVSVVLEQKCYFFAWKKML